MSWRVVTVNSRCKLECRLNYLVSRGEQTIKVHLSEIAVLIVENTAVSITASLLCELNKRKIKVIFCDEKHNPSFELTPTSLRYDTSGQLFKQLEWAQKEKVRVWTAIIEQKIKNQRDVLLRRGLNDAAQLLTEYLQQLVPGDETNREGHAAKVYFNALFGMSFSRHDDTPINGALDYGYSILLSAVNRAVAAFGYCANLGICHHNEYNHFNLSCDLMEPLRMWVDEYVLSMENAQLDTEGKHKLQQIINQEVTFNGRRYTLNTALPFYVKSVVTAIEDGVDVCFCQV